jgi:hypothetical protein
VGGECALHYHHKRGALFCGASYTDSLNFGKLPNLRNMEYQHMAFLSRAISACSLTACTLILVAACGGGGGGGGGDSTAPVGGTGATTGSVTPATVPSTTNTVATPRPEGFASISKFVPAGQALQDYPLTSCETTVIQGTNRTETPTNFATATLSLMANGDVSAIFIDAAGKLSGFSITPAAMRDVYIYSERYRSDPLGELFDGHRVDIEFQLGNNRAALSLGGDINRSSFSFIQFELPTTTSLEKTTVLRCDMPAGSLVRQIWPQPDTLTAYLRGVTVLNSTGTKTSTLANGVLRWDNLDGRVLATPEQGLNRYMQVNLTTGLLSAGSSPTASPMAIAWPASPSTIDYFSFREETRDYGASSDIEIVFAPVASASSWSLQMSRTNNTIQPIARLQGNP